MKKHLTHYIGSLIGLVLFCCALWVMHRELRAYHYHDVIHQLKAIPLRSLLIAFVLTVLSYLALTGYDTLAFRLVRRSIPYNKIALASFIGYAFSHNLGFFLLTGGSLRYRFYTAWGISASECTNIVAFCSLTAWTGFLWVSGILFVLHPFALPSSLPLPIATVQPMGVLFLSVLVGYFLLAFFHKRTFHIREWKFRLPSPRLSFVQLTLSSMDWLLAGGVLYTLLHPSADLSYFHFMALYLLAQITGILSQVPGGVGVFETIILFFLKSYLPAPSILGSLLLFRILYYFLPLIIAAILLAGYESLQNRELVGRYAKLFGQWVPGVIPDILTVTTFLGGTILLISGVTPTQLYRLHWMKDIVPLQIIEISHFLGSIIGIMLIVLSRGLQRRLDAAYFLTVLFLFLGIAVSLLKGLDFEEAAVLAIMLAALLPSHSQFYRKSSLLSPRFTPGWISAILLVLLSSVWLCFFSFKHIEYSHDLWWRFTLTGEAPRSLRALVGSFCGIFLFTTLKLMRPMAVKPTVTISSDWESIRRIVEQSPSTLSHLALLGDKYFLFNEEKNAFLMYAVEGRSWITLGDPVGPVSEWRELIWRFQEMCDDNNGWPVFYQVNPDTLHLYLDVGMTLVKLGEEAHIPLQHFSLDGTARRGFRQVLHQCEKAGLQFEIVSPQGISFLFPQLREISEAWLAEKKTREKRFALGFLSEEYLLHFPLAAIRQQGAILAFANLLQGAGLKELSIDLMRYHPQGPPGIMDYLLIQLLLWGKQKGFHTFNLGMAPLSGLDEHAHAPIWNRLGGLVFRHGEHFYNFRGIRRYKEKFDPIWVPKYLASPGGIALPIILTNLSSLISGGLKGVVTK